jgi:hypothetical protein
MLTSDERKVRDKLREWSDRLSEGLALFGQTSSVSAPDKARRQAWYRKIQADMRAEAQRAASIQSAMPLTPAERRWYARPIQHASAHLTARTNAAPQTVFRSLFVARADIEIGISRMRDALKGSRQ